MAIKPKSRAHEDRIKALERTINYQDQLVFRMERAEDRVNNLWLLNIALGVTCFLSLAGVILLLTK